MSDMPDEVRHTRRRANAATCLASHSWRTRVGAVSGRGAARSQSQPQASGPTVYVGSEDGTLYAVDAATGSQEWAFTQPSFRIRSSPTVVADPESGDSIGSRVMLGTLGHRGDRADRVTTETDPGGSDTDDETGTDGGGGDTADETGTDGDGGDTDTQTGGDGFGPGFGGALAGLGSAGCLLKRRLEPE
jgi:WD-40 repeat-containing protein